MDLATRYADALEELLPPGRLFQAPVGAVLRSVLEALAEEVARAHGRVERLLAEQAPRSTSELLPDWERVLGLPDSCSVVSSSVELRRAAVLSRVAVQGGQSRAVLAALALVLGYVITIEEHPTFRVGGRVGDRVYGVDGGWPWTFSVHAPVVTSFFFRAGASSAGDPLSTSGNEPLECAFARVKPAHAHLLFVYDLQAHPADWQPWGWHVVPQTLVVRAVFPPYTVAL